MRGDKRTKKRLWRWRSNPLRRHDDVLESWLVLAVWALIAVGGTFAGVVTARAADDAFAQQRAERSPVRAVLVEGTPQAASGYRVLARVRWTTPDGSVHADRTLVDTGQKAGSRIKVWTNTQGELTTAPPSRSVAAVAGGFLGAAAALAVSGLVAGTGGATRWWLDRRRIDQWGREWDLVGPAWGHKTS